MIAAESAHMIWRIRGGAMSLARPVILGIINVTPDSFSDGGNFFSLPRGR